MSSYRDRQIADEYRGNVAQCRSCKDQTDHETLVSLGGLCNACFAHYCDPVRSEVSILEAAAKRALIGRLRTIVASRGSHLPNTATPAERVIERLSTFEQRTGRALSDSQRHVLECCRRHVGHTEVDS
jgi:hypothetical protein